jgi:hypothetical protein
MIEHPALADMRHGRGGFVIVDRDPHQFGAGSRQGFDLCHRTVDVGGIGIGHGLDDDRGLAADGHCAYFYG